MGIPSGGSFGGSSEGGSSSGFSSGGRFDDYSFSRDNNSNHHHHHHHGSFNDPFYYNNQPRPYRESSGGGGSGGGDKWCRTQCSVLASFFAFLGSFWVIAGFSKSDQLLMSLNYSRLISANPVFIKEVQIHNLRDPGPVVHLFSQRPALQDSVNYNETHDDLVESYSHKEWRFWLNQGSTIEFSYDVKGFTQDYLVLAFIRGTDGLEDWTRAPNTPAKTLKWFRIHGSGVKDFVADQDGDYFIAYGNLNRQDMEVTSELKIHSTLYSVQGADKRMAFTKDVDVVSAPLSLFHAKSVLLTTPSEPQGDADIWEVAVVYTTRWITYIVFWGAIAVALVLVYGLDAGRANLFRRSREELPLLAPQEDQAVPSHAASNSSSVGIPTSLGEVDENGEGSPREDAKLCSICLDAPKDCFFDPCGHRCTCYSCGQRIQSGNNGLCPLCRQPIRAVRKIFDS